MARHYGVTGHNLTVEYRFWPIPLPTPAGLDIAESPVWRWLSIHVGWYVPWLWRRRVIAVGCECCDIDDWTF